MSYIDLIKKRRSIYALGKTVSLAEDKIEEIIKNVVKDLPSAFNSQTARIVILFNQYSDKVWDITKDILKEKVPADAFVATETKLNSFKAGIGTVLFFEEQNTVKNLQEKFPSYADNFPIWSMQSTGIAVHAIWLALAEQQIGASIQHYNPLIDTKIKEEFNLPESWLLTGQMPFGSIEAQATEKTYLEETRVVVHK